jgi:HPt (histidine-containing phosphotransfer) domain-containing protein
VSAEQDALIRAAFAELHDGFALKLPARIAGLAEAVRAAEASPDDAALREVAGRSAHALRGAAGSYGFPEISASAATIEDALAELRARLAPDPASSWAVIVESLAELERAATTA